MSLIPFKIFKEGLFKKFIEGNLFAFGIVENILILPIIDHSNQSFHRLSNSVYALFISFDNVDHNVYIHHIAYGES